MTCRPCWAQGQERRQSLLQVQRPQRVPLHLQV